jgi:biopolymer transport protein ExbD
MHFKRHIKLEQGLKTLDIAPLVDVVFLLLIFFMLTSNFVFQPGMMVNLPKAVTSEAIKREDITLIISSENFIYFKGEIILLQELKKLIHQAGLSSQAVLIKADKQASLGKVVEIWDICRQAGVRQVNIATNKD